VERGGPFRTVVRVCLVFPCGFVFAEHRKINYLRDCTVEGIVADNERRPFLQLYKDFMPSQDRDGTWPRYSTL
jgi:hypothetical protein